jgi:ABC-2 type transport system permease protein
MSSFTTTALIATREITERLRSRLTWVMTAITTVLVVALIVVPSFFRQPTRPTVIGLVGAQAQSLAPAILATAKAAKLDITVLDIADDATARAGLMPTPTTRQGPFARALAAIQGSGSTIDVALTVNTDSAVVEVNQSLSPNLAALLQAIVDEAHQAQVLIAAGVPPATVSTALQPVKFSIVTLQPPVARQAGADVAALAAGFLLYVSVGIFGAAVANGVAQEKTSRTAEVLLAAVRPIELMIGKVLGIGLVGLAQMAATVGAGLVVNAFVQSSALPSSIWVLLPAILGWFLLGYLLYAFGYAAAGAIVARQEEVQFATAPFTVFLVGGFLLTYATIATPDAWWIRLLSFFPPLSPVLMPARLALGHLEVWEMPLAALLTAGFIALVAREASRIYSAGLVRSGARLSWGAALRRR